MSFVDAFKHLALATARVIDASQHSNSAHGRSAQKSNTRKPAKPCCIANAGKLPTVSAMRQSGRR